MFMQVQEMEAKLNKLQSGVILVKPEDKKIIEESFSEKVTQWRKRKRMFKELRDNITENSPKCYKSEALNRSIEDKQSQQTRHRDLVTQFGKHLHLRCMLYGRSSPGTQHSTVDDKPAAVYRHIRSTTPRRSSAPAMGVGPSPTFLCLT